MWHLPAQFYVSNLLQRGAWTLIYAGKWFRPSLKNISDCTIHVLTAGSATASQTGPGAIG